MGGAGFHKTMTSHRFFVPAAWFKDGDVTLIEDVAHQIRRVLRLQAGSRIVVLDDSGREFEVELRHVGQKVVIGRVLRERKAGGEPGTRIRLYQAVLKARKFEWVLQKGTELGVSDFLPTICQRSVTGEVQNVEKKRERWESIIREAAEQSWRGRLPVLHAPLFFNQACQQARESSQLQLIPWEDEEQLQLKAALRQYQAQSGQPQSISLFVGPEGGFTPEEIQTAHQYGLRPVSLGPRILRAETAGLAATSVILYELEG
jgi:16S rRNA (uracil1498-N3)-methyltransferase